MPPIPGKPKSPKPRKYRYGVDKFVCVCGAVHWYDVKRCQGCNRSGPLPLVTPQEYAKMRDDNDENRKKFARQYGASESMIAQRFDDPDEDDDDENGEDE